MEFLKDLFRFLMQRKKWWLIPLIIFLLIIGILLVFGSGSALAPFIYIVALGFLVLCLVLFLKIAELIMKEKYQSQ